MSLPHGTSIILRQTDSEVTVYMSIMWTSMAKGKRKEMRSEQEAEANSKQQTLLALLSVSRVTHMSQTHRGQMSITLTGAAEAPSAGLAWTTLPTPNLL